MLTIYSSASLAPQIWRPGDVAVANPIWIDLVDPSEDERRQGNLLLGVTLPTRQETSAIELSSRLRSSEKVLRLNIPSFVRTEGDRGPLTPLGFVLTPQVLASVRYAQSLAFDQVAKTLAAPEPPHGGIEVFVSLLESIVDVAADRIETLAGELSALSGAVFAEDRKHRGLLRGALFRVGAMQRRITQVQLSILGVSRLVKYLCEVAPPWIDHQLLLHLRTVQSDIGSLDEFDQQLGERLQFLLDAVLGFINNDQNDIMRVLTIVSVVTVPPMILAGIWGMNFKSIPEYNWQHGYAFALSMIALSIAIPLLWFKLKKWL